MLRTTFWSTKPLGLSSTILYEDLGFFVCIAITSRTHTHRRSPYAIRRACKRPNIWSSDPVRRSSSSRCSSFCSLSSLPSMTTLMSSYASSSSFIRRSSESFTSSGSSTSSPSVFVLWNRAGLMSAATMSTHFTTMSR